MLRSLALAVWFAAAGAASGEPLDANTRAEALRHLGIIQKESAILAKLTSAPDAAPVASAAPAPVADQGKGGTSPAPTLADANRVSRAILDAATAMRAEIESKPEGEELGDLHDDIETSVDELEPVLKAVPPRNGARSRYSNLRWSTQRLAAVLELETGATPKFTVGPVTAEQAQLTRDRIAALASRANDLRAGLERAPADLMYRNLLISQMSAFVEPAARLNVALGNAPWWTPEAYQAVTQVTRLIDLTKNETRKLTPELFEKLKAVWTACEELVAAANDIEKGARGTGPEAQIQYLERP